jgi:hypothetical protein
MKKASVVCVAALLLGEISMVNAQGNGALVVTSSNAAANQLLVYNTAGTLVQTVSTQGQGGAGSNAGGIAAQGDTVAVVNFGSQSVSIFELGPLGFALRQVVPAVSDPVSVAFGLNHLYILGTTTVESHRIEISTVDADADGVVDLARADGSAAQVGVAGDALVLTEKSGAIEVVALRSGLAVGPAVEVKIPADSDTPFGLVTRGDNAYVTIAHSDEVSLIKNGRLVALAATSTGFPNGQGQHAPCWIALTGPYLFTSNSPSHSLSRLLATGGHITLDIPVAAHTVGAPIDIAANDTRLAVLEDNGSGQAHLTQFRFDDNDNLVQVATTAIASPANGVAIVSGR